MKKFKIEVSNFGIKTYNVYEQVSSGWLFSGSFSMRKLAVEYIKEQKS